MLCVQLMFSHIHIHCYSLCIYLLYPYYTNTKPALSKHELEPEFLLSVYEPVKFDLQSAKIKGYHVEKIARRSTFTSSVLEGFKKAHFTVMAVSGVQYHRPSLFIYRV